jgi:salicylate hydroxylase
VSFQQDHEGVTTIFSDGTSAHGGVLVGADGSNSAVRTQLLHGFKATPAPFINFIGDVVLSKAHYEPLLKHSTNGYLIGGLNLKGNFLLMKYLEEGTAMFNWTIAWRTENFEEDHIKWQRASSEEQLEKTLQLVKDWPPEVVRGIAQSKASNILTPPYTLLETVLPAQGLPKSRVTLIGDAAHSMVRL